MEASLRDQDIENKLKKSELEVQKWKEMYDRTVIERDEIGLELEEKYEELDELMVRVAALEKEKENLLFECSFTTDL